MFRFDADRPVEFCDGLRRRDFLHAGALPLLGLGLSQFLGLKAQGAVADDKSGKNCIFLMLVGGPSQLDTWDPKPNAPIEIRGPYKAIKTNVPGIEISENFPRMAKQADRYALIRGYAKPTIASTANRAGRPAKTPQSHLQWRTLSPVVEIFPVVRSAVSPNQTQRLNDIADWSTLRNHQQYSRTCVP